MRNQRASGVGQSTRVKTTSLAAFTVIGALLLLGFQQASGQIAFKLTTNLLVGPQPLAITATDFSGDGNPDFIAVSSANVRAFTNNGFGGFASNATYNVVGVRGVGMADLNGDGFADLVCYGGIPVPQPFIGMISVMTNNGSGGFTSCSSINAGNRFNSVALADANGDSKLDLIAADSTPLSGSVFVFTNTGSASFALSSSNSVEDDPFTIVAADLNGDGWVDFATANYTVNTVSVLTNNQAGQFSLCAVRGVGSRPLSLASGDINGDGALDLVTANSANNSSGNSLSVLTNDGSGGFAVAATCAAGRNPCSVLTIDVNSDGKIDLISGDFIDNTMSVLTNNGSGQFALATVSPIGVNPRGMVMLDANSDGRPDFASANFSGTASVIINVPVLSIERQQDQVRVWWPTSWTNWTLLESSNPLSGNWGTRLDIANDGTNKSLSVSPTGKSFFRLSFP